MESQRDTVEFYLHVQSHILYSPMTGLTNTASLPKVDFNIQGLLHPRFLETMTSKKRDLFALLWNILQSPSFHPASPPPPHPHTPPTPPTPTSTAHYDSAALINHMQVHRLRHIRCGPEFFTGVKLYSPTHRKGGLLEIF